MDIFRAPWVVAAVLGALFAAIGIAGKASGRLGGVAVDRFYYAGYGFMILSMLLFILRGFLSGRA